MTYDAVMRPIHQQEFRVRSYETDPDGRLQVQILCKLMQEAATAHAAALDVAVETLLESGVAWVLSNLRLDVKSWPGPNAEIVVKNWPSSISVTSPSATMVRTSYRCARPLTLTEVARFDISSCVRKMG